jgi:hypothetical protein
VHLRDGASNHKVVLNCIRVRYHVVIRKKLHCLRHNKVNRLHSVKYKAIIRPTKYLQLKHPLLQSKSQISLI